MEKVRWGILSCSLVARKRWIPGIRATRGGQVAAIASRTREKADAWARELEIPRAHGSYEALLEDDQVDAVYIGLPNSLHREWVIKSLRAGKAVLCDKPLGLNAAEAEQMQQVAEQERRLLVEGFMYFHHSQYEQIDKWIQAGRIGRLRMIRAGFAFHFEREGNYRHDPQYGGGALLDLGCYCVHAIRRITGREPIRALARCSTNKLGADWTSHVILEFDENLQASFDCSFEYQSNQMLHIAGTAGHIESDRPFSPAPRTTLSLLDTDPVETIKYKEERLYAATVRAFQERWLQGDISTRYAQDAVANLRVLDMIRSAIK